MCEIFHFYTHIWFPCLYPICKSKLHISVLIGKIYLHVYGSDQRVKSKCTRYRRASFQRDVHMARTYFRTTVVWVSTGTVVEATGVETTTSSDAVKIGCRSLSWSSVEAISFLFSIYVKRKKSILSTDKKEDDEKGRGNAMYMSALRSVIVSKKREKKKQKSTTMTATKRYIKKWGREHSMKFSPDNYFLLSSID